MREIAILSLLGTILFVVQLAIAALPNVELVSTLVVVYALVFGRKSFYPIYVFVLLEGFLFGFGIWWFSYLYVWSLLAIIAMLCRKNRNPVVWAMICACFGLFFGGLCAIPYFFTGGLYAAFSFWAAGIVFDIVHCAGNFVVTLALFRPIHVLFAKLAPNENLTKHTAEKRARTTCKTPFEDLDESLN